MTSVNKFSWQLGHADNLSTQAVAEKDRRLSFPSSIEFHNPSIKSIRFIQRGIVEVIPNSSTEEFILVSGGVHGNEKAGQAIVDALFKGFVSNLIPVNRPVLLVLGSLEAMAANNGLGVRAVGPQEKATSNMNRAFGGDPFVKPYSVSEVRAQQMMECLNQFSGQIESGIDIHQSFLVPSIGEEADDYTYGMLYPSRSENLQETIDWIETFGSVLNGVVLNETDLVHSTWAGFMARELSANSVTFEMGQIGRIDERTKTPKLFELLVDLISGSPVVSQTDFDVWKKVRAITKETPDFHFCLPNGERMDEAPVDFSVLPPGLIAKDGEKEYNLAEGQRPLFANSDVVIGDRTVVFIEKQ
jgi:succinylglutamate desuccinylase